MVYKHVYVSLCTLALICTGATEVEQWIRIALAKYLPKEPRQSSHIIDCNNGI